MKTGKIRLLYLLQKEEDNQRPHGKGPRLSQDQVEDYLQASSVVPVRPEEVINLANQTRENAWADHPVWANYATQLDESSLAFFLPSHFKALTVLTRFTPPYVEAWTRSGSLCFYFVGSMPAKRRFGPFWDPQCEDHYVSRKPEIPSDAYRVFAFGRAVQQDLDIQERAEQWSKAYTASQDYLILHRRYVRKAGSLLGVDMECHDLSKTRLLSTALALLFHFEEERTQSDPHEKNLNQLAWDAVRAGHLELENHHPEFKGQHSPVDPLKLFVDRLSVRVQKNGYPGMDSWDMPLHFIPMEYRELWEQFKAENQHVDLYAHLCPAKKNDPQELTTHLPPKTLERKQKPSEEESPCCCPTPSNSEDISEATTRENEDTTPDVSNDTPPPLVSDDESDDQLGDN